MMVLMVLRQIWIPQPLYWALPWVAATVGAAGIVASGPSVGLLAVSWAVMSYGMVIMVVRLALGGLSHV